MEIKFDRLLTHQERLALLAQAQSELDAIRAESAALADLQRRKDLAGGLIFLTPQAE